VYGNDLPSPADQVQDADKEDENEAAWWHTA